MLAVTIVLAKYLMATRARNPLLQPVRLGTPKPFQSPKPIPKQASAPSPATRAIPVDGPTTHAAAALAAGPAVPEPTLPPNCGLSVLRTLNLNEFFGEVLLARDNAAGFLVVVKKLEKARVDHKLIENEISAGKMLTHPNLVKMLRSFEDSKYAYIVLEHVPGDDMFEYMDARDFAPFTEKEARHLFRQMCEALSYCHSKGVIHRDLKLENVMLLGGPPHWRIKIIDFGLCDIGVRCSDLSYRWCGSVDYVCPEILLKQPYIGCKADVWSLGTTLYSMLYGQLPFSYKERSKIRTLAEHPKLQFPAEPPISEQGKDLLSRMLEPEPDKRLDLHQVMKHKWVRKKFFGLF